MRPSRREVALALLGLGLGGCRRRTAPGNAVDDVEVDLESSPGRFERLSGVQGSPAPLLDGEPELTDAFRAARIARCRVDQDCAPNSLTLGGVFPDEAADPDAASSYRFEAIDRHLRAARAAGASVLWQASYDVGRSDRWVGFNLGGRPPEDLARWGRVVTRCLAHFNGDFAQGLTGAVADVEFLNEPDGLGGFHGPHAPRLGPAFLSFLDVVERHNRAHPTGAVRAVGPGVPLSWAEWPGYAPRFEALLRAVKASARALPVFSFHTYGDDVSPRGNQRLAEALRTLLDANGFEATELWNTEWQAGDFLRGHLDVDVARVERSTDEERRAFASAFATYAIACKLRWQGLVRGSYYYRANARVFPPEYRPPLPAVGLARFFGRDGRPGPLAHQEALLARAHDATPVRCETRLDDDGLLAVQALRAEDNGAVSVLAANLSLRPRRLQLHLRGGGAKRTGALVALDARGLSERAVAAPDEEFSVEPLGVAWLRLDAHV